MKYVGVIGVLFALGCAEGVKPNPLPRAGVAALTPRKDGDAANAPRPLYARLEGEKGLTETVVILVKRMSQNSKTKPLADKLDANNRPLVLFLMDVSSNPPPWSVESVNLDAGEWSLLVPALGETLNAREVADADRDELLTKIRTSLKGAKR